MGNINKLFAIKCKQCQNNWKVIMPLSGNDIEVFATICQCGALIVGNYNYKIANYNKKEDNPENYIKKVYLTNGHFEILDLDENEINKLQELRLE